MLEGVTVRLLHHGLPQVRSEEFVKEVDGCCGCVQVS